MGHPGLLCFYRLPVAYDSYVPAQKRAAVAINSLKLTQYIYGRYRVKGWLLKEGDGHIFKSCDISLENTPTSYAVSLALVMCACSDSTMALVMHLLTNSSKWVCLH